MTGRFSNDELQGFIKEVVAIAEEAGEAAMDHYDEVDVDVEYKDDQSPLTEADVAADRLIGEQLGAMEVDIPVLSEESADIEWEDRCEWDAFWSVDPLDGTKEFLKKNGEFTINIGLVQDERPSLGVVHAPALEKTFFAAEGMGAFAKESGDVEMITTANEVPDPVVVVVSRSHINEPTRAYVETLEEDHEVETMPTGSSLKLCMVAENAAQVYPRLAPTMEWDTAAAHCVAEQAGATVEAPNASTLTYNKQDLHNPYFVISALPELVPEGWDELAE